MWTWRKDGIREWKHTGLPGGGKDKVKKARWCLYLGFPFALDKTYKFYPHIKLYLYFLHILCREWSLTSCIQEAYKLPSRNVQLLGWWVKRSLEDEVLLESSDDRIAWATLTVLRSLKCSIWRCLGHNTMPEMQSGKDACKRSTLTPALSLCLHLYVLSRKRQCLFKKNVLWI